ncbi:MAG: hypothetical protein RMK20_15005 [Verrucomicrobiales bacterium]|nr:hypothetical protein [Verrucomicrobiales bacterium]
MAAGVLASACTRRAPCSLLLAVLLNAGFVGLLAVGLGSGFYTLGGVVLPAVIDEFDSFLAQAAIVSLLLLVRLLDAADWMTGVFPLGMAGWLQGVLIVEATALAGLIFLLAVACAALRLKRLRFEAPPSIEQLRLRASLFAPRFWSGRFRAARRRRLARNPVLWLQSYSPTARLARWGWCLVVVLYGCLLGSSGYPAEAFDDTYPLIQWLLLLGMASGAANSFRTERENGLLELLLVAPLTEGQIIAGRVRGLWSQHLPAVGMFLGLVGFVEWARVVNPPWYGPDPEATWWWFLPMLAALPVVGLFFALRLRVHSLAILSALFFGVVWPLSMPGMMAYAIKRAEFHLNLSLDGMVPGFLVAEDSSFWFFATLALVTGLCGYQLRRDLARRNFVAS